MYDLEDLITDRTKADVDNRTNKGYYNISDLQRVNTYILFLAEKLKLQVPSVTFELGEKVAFEKLTILLDNIKTLREHWYIANDTPEVPNVAGWNFDSANAIEKNLLALTEFLFSYETDHKYSGTFNSGEEIIFT